MKQTTAAPPAATICLLLLLCSSLSGAIRSLPPEIPRRLPSYAEALHLRNGDHCPAPAVGAICDASHVNVAMTLDSRYLRGTIAAVHSLLFHASCPLNLYLHFIISKLSSKETDLEAVVRSTFPSLKFRVYEFDEDLVRDLISPSVRAALESPLNYARAYLADLLEPCVSRVIYLDSDVIVIDDIFRLWETRLPPPAVLAAPVYCEANFTRYFTQSFWSAAGSGSSVFAGRRHKPCYFNTGVMLMDLSRWRAGRHREKIEGWMRMQKEMRIYNLGSLPPFLLEFAGEVEAVEHRWNQHGLGGDNEAGSCRGLHPGPVSLLHWSGKGKPWDRLDAGKPCPVDELWVPYDLYRPSATRSAIQ